MGKRFNAILFNFAITWVQVNHEGLKLSGKCRLIR